MRQIGRSSTSKPQRGNLCRELKGGFEDELPSQEEKQDGGRRAGGPLRASRMNEQIERWRTARTDDWRSSVL